MHNTETRLTRVDYTKNILRGISDVGDIDRSDLCDTLLPPQQYKLASNSWKKKTLTTKQSIKSTIPNIDNEEKDNEFQYHTESTSPVEKTKSIPPRALCASDFLPANILEIGGYNLYLLNFISSSISIDKGIYTNT